MVDTRPVRRTRTPKSLTEQHGSGSLVASTQLLTADNTRSLVINPRDWQREAWNFYHSMGELRYAVSDWFGNAMSRVRLVPCVVLPGKDPEPITDGPVAQLVSELAGGIGGQAAAMKKFAVSLTVPGGSE